MPTEKDLNELSARIDDLIKRIEFIADPAVRANVVTLVQSLMDLHQRGFSRIAELLQGEERGNQIMQALASDELVGGLLVLYGVHPEGLGSRIKRAVAKAAREFAPSKNTVELMGVDEGIVRIRLRTTAGGCSGGNSDIEQAIREAVCSEAPDVDHIEIERISAPKNADTLVQLQVGAAAIDS